MIKNYQQKGDEFNIFKFQTQDEENFEYFKRMQVFAQFFIDGASFSENDPNWTIYALFKKNQQFNFVGYVSVYRFY